MDLALWPAGGNQVRHFMAGLNFGYRTSVFRRWIHILRPDEWADMKLNAVSTRIGERLRFGQIGAEEIGDEIRRVAR